MKFSYFTLSVAFRHLRFGVGQSLLTLGVVAISVVLIIYLRTVIGGSQIRIVNSATGVIAHVALEPERREPIGAWSLPGADAGPLYVGEATGLPRIRDRIDDWRQWVPALQGDPEVTLVSPVATGNAFLVRGERRLSVRVTGALPEVHDNVVDIERYLLEGHYVRMISGEVVLGTRLAREAGIRMKDRLQLVGPDGRTLSVTVAGLYDTGVGQLDDGQVFLSLRDAQTLLELGNAVSEIGLRLADIYRAEEIARDLGARLPFEARSWITDNPNVFRTIDAQNQTINLVLISTIVAAGFGIASVLIMGVTGKFREIGILKAMGATPAEIQTIFVIEGFLLALLGCGVGIPVALALLEALGRVRAPGPGGRETEVFLIQIDPALLAGAAIVAVTIGVVAALFPARRAGRVDPMQVIRGA